jgi:uncharacterized protein (TIGR03435 family)
VRRPYLSAWMMAALLGGVCAHLGGQGPATAPAFEVASVKPNQTGGERSMLPTPTRFTAINVTLRQLIRAAYGRRAFDDPAISGGPNWLDTDHFDVIANTKGDLATLYLGDGRGSPGLAYVMLRTLLADRFRLVVHTETRTLPVYALVNARQDGQPGEQLERSAVDCDVVLAEMAAAIRQGRPPVRRDPRGLAPCAFAPGPGRLSGSSVTMAQFADTLASSVNRPVIDRTGLKGNFTFDLKWAPEESAGPSGDLPSIFTAVQEQLGLKLQTTTAPVEVIVIDRVERPTPD